MNRFLCGVAVALVSVLSGCGPETNTVSPDTYRYDLPDSQPSGGACFSVPPSQDYDPLANYSLPTGELDIVVLSTADNGAGSLREAIAGAVAGQTIGFASDLAEKTIRLTSTLYVKASISINGSAAPGLTLDGGGQIPILETAKACDVSLYGLIFMNGRHATSGGAIHAGQTDQNQSGGKLTVAGCTFINNAGGRGGAIRVGWRTVGVIENCVFYGNNGTIGSDRDRGFSGGAISTSQSAELTVRRCRFENNQGHNGGAIYNILQPVTIDSCVFVNNTAQTSGAFFTDGGNPAGPGNDPANTGRIELRHLRVVGSSGSSVGGAMLLWAYPGDVITIEQCIFYDNEVYGGGDGGKGGAIRIANPGSLLIANSSFANNRAYQQGGALWIDGSGPVVMENVSFSGNYVQSDAGGGFNYNGSGSVRINGALFADNYAGRACGAFWFGKRDLDMVVKNTIFAFNQAGQNRGERHMGYRPTFEGGILEFVDTLENVGRVTDASLFADPLLGELQEIDGMLTRPLLAGSPAIGYSTGESPQNDMRGALRDANPDTGPFEFGTVCQ